jgi:hypothetical protein
MQLAGTMMLVAYWIGVPKALRARRVNRSRHMVWGGHDDAGGLGLA